MKKIKFVFMLSLILSALCLTSCSERIDAGSEGILVNLYGTDKGVDDVKPRYWPRVVQSIHRGGL